MRFTITRRVAATGLVTALAAGGSVLGLAGSAQAATASYTCQTLAGPITIPMSLDASALDAAPLPTGFAVPGGLAPVTGSAVLPASLTGAVAFLLPTVTDLGATISGFALSAGGTSIPIQDLKAAPVPLSASDLTLPAAGTVGGFTAPLPGVYDVSLPSSFSMTPITSVAGITLPGSTCNLADAAQAVIGQLTVVKQTSTTAAKVKKAGSSFKAVVTVVRQLGSAATGKVTASVKGKKVATKKLSKKGVASFTLPRSVKGKNVVFSYAGDELTSASKASATAK